MATVCSAIHDSGNFPLVRGVRLGMSKLLLAVLLFASIASSRSAIAQQAAAPPLPVYDIVVIKLNKSLTRGTHTDMDDATFQATKYAAQTPACDFVRHSRRPDLWLARMVRSACYDVNAKVTDPDLKAMRSLTREQRQAMLAAILVDRLHLQTHFEQKTLPVYELVIAKSGPKL